MKELLVNERLPSGHIPKQNSTKFCDSILSSHTQEEVRNTMRASAIFYVSGTNLTHVIKFCAFC